MREVLEEWYPPTDDQRNQVMTDGLFVFDTNSLLSLYRLNQDDRTRVLELLEVLQERIWIPYRVGLEFHRNRINVLHEQLQAYKNVKKDIKGLRDKITQHRTHPVLSLSNTRREIIDRLHGLESFVDSKQEELHPVDTRDPVGEDGVLNALTSLFDGRVGDCREITDDRLQEARRRANDKVPPGFKDKNKGEPDCYGDFFVWAETLDHVAPADQADPDRPLMFVTEENKADWWRFTPDGRGQKVGPRPELIREAADRGIRPVWMTGLSRFYSAGATYVGWEITSLGEFAPVEEGESDAGQREDNANP